MYFEVEIYFIVPEVILFPNYFYFNESNRVEDAVIRYLNRKPVAGSDAPGST